MMSAGLKKSGEQFTLIELLACQGVAHRATVSGIASLRRRKRSTAFTLIELLVVIAIISILVAMLLPAIAQSKKMAMSSQCLNNQHQVSLAILQYAEDFQGWIPGNNIYGWMGGGAAAWSVMYAMPISGRYGRPDAGIYLQNPTVLVCPSQNPPVQYEWGGTGTTTWQTYGIISNGSSGSWNGFLWTDWTKVLTNGSTYWDRWIYLTRCPKPSSFAMLADTINNTSGAKSIQWQFFEPGGTGGAGNHYLLHTRHNNGANFTFFDGHCENVKETALSSELALRYYCRQNYIDAVLP